MTFIAIILLNIDKLKLQKCNLPEERKHDTRFKKNLDPLKHESKT